MRYASLKHAVLVTVGALIVAIAAPVGTAAPIGNSHVAALQAALSQRGYEIGTIDGLIGPVTRTGIERFQAENELPITGKANVRTVEALGGPARRVQGGTSVRRGDSGWNVVRLQFLLAWHGFPSGTLDGNFGERVERATADFQAWARLPADGVAGPGTFKALRTPPARPKVRLSLPLAAPIGDSFGPRGDRFHAGLDLPAPAGDPVAAAKAGTVAFAGFHEGGFGNLVVIQHRHGLRTRYGHLSELNVTVGEPVRRGQTIGLVGSTGRSTGPHLHVEVLFRGALIDPLPLLRG